MFVEIEEMTEEQAKKALRQLVDELDDLDRNDFFGTEGWRHFMGFED